MPWMTMNTKKVQVGFCPDCGFVILDQTRRKHIACPRCPYPTTPKPKRHCDPKEPTS